jgi:hypothetical protein
VALGLASFLLADGDEGIGVSDIELFELENPNTFLSSELLRSRTALSISPFSINP